MRTPSFGENARRIAVDAARHDALAEITRHLAEVRVAARGDRRKALPRRGW